MAKKWKYDATSKAYKHFCYLCLEYKEQAEFSSAANVFCTLCNNERNKSRISRHKTTREERSRSKESKRIKETISKIKESK